MVRWCQYTDDRSMSNIVVIHGMVKFFSWLGENRLFDIWLLGAKQKLILLVPHKATVKKKKCA